MNIYPFSTFSSSEKPIIVGKQSISLERKRILQNSIFFLKARILLRAVNTLNVSKFYLFSVNRSIKCIVFCENIAYIGIFEQSNSII